MPLLSFSNALAVRTPVANRFADAAVWTVAGTAGSNLITLMTTVVVARVLGKHAYGQFVLLQSGISMMGVFAGFGMGVAVTKYVAEFRSRDSRRVARILSLCNRAVLTFGIVVAVFLLPVAPRAAKMLLNDAGLSLAVSIAAFAVLFITLDGFQKSVLIGFESARAYAKAAILGGVLGVPILIGAAYFGGFNGVVAALAFSSLLQLAISRWQVRVQLRRFNVPHTAQGCLAEWRVIWDFAFPALLAGLLVPLSHWICQRMLVGAPDGFGEIALLGVGMQWFNAIMFLPTVSGRVVLPMLTGYVTSENSADSKKLLLLAMRANALIAFPMALVIAVVSPWILSLYGPGFSRGAPVLIVAVFTAALLGVQSPVGNMVAAVSRMWLGMLMNIG
jgi:O-antigen/teichoic acid export membrane protein